MNNSKSKITPAMKGLLTKAVKTASATYGPKHPFCAVRAIFAKVMPQEQAKHATRKYLSNITVTV